MDEPAITVAMTAWILRVPAVAVRDWGRAGEFTFTRDGRVLIADVERIAASTPGYRRMAPSTLLADLATFDDPAALAAMAAEANLHAEETFDNLTTLGAPSPDFWERAIIEHDQLMLARELLKYAGTLLTAENQSRLLILLASDSS